MFRLIVILVIVASLGVGFVYLLNANANVQSADNYPSKTITFADLPSGNETQAPASPLVEKNIALTNAPERRNKPFPMTIDKNKKYLATLHTSLGNIVVSLNAASTPITVNNFVNLAQSKFYNNTIFHRVIKGFMIQGGDPKGDGTGGPGYHFDDEPFTGEYTRGTIAMANSGPNTNGSQFFIMHATYPLPKNYVIFGHVTSGLEVVDKIATAPVQNNGGEASRPVNPVVVTAVDVKEE